MPLQLVFDDPAHVRVDGREHALFPLEEGDLFAEAAERLGKLESDVSRADDRSLLPTLEPRSDSESVVEVDQ